MKAQLDVYATQCEELSAKNRTMKRELLAARNCLEQQQAANEAAEAATTMTEEARNDSDNDETERLRTLVAQEQALRADAERTRNGLAVAHLRSNQELADAQAQLAGLRAELVALRVAEQQQIETQASAVAADATAVATLTTQLQDKHAALEAANRSVQQLTTRVEMLEADSARTTASLEAERTQEVAEKERALTAERETIASLQQELLSVTETRAALETRLEEQIQADAAQRSEAEEMHRVLKRESRAFERDLKTALGVAKERDEELRAAQRRTEALGSQLLEMETAVTTARQAGYAEAERAVRSAGLRASG